MSLLTVSILKGISPKLRCFHRSAVNDSEFGWFNKLVKLPRAEETLPPSSGRLSTLESVYELQKEDVQPGNMDDYLKYLENLTNETKSKTPGYGLAASFRVIIGDQDQVVNLWKYEKGYSSHNEIHKIFQQDKTLQKLENDRLKCLRKRTNQFCLEFSFWDQLQPAKRDNFYEMRSYLLRPGTLLDWSNSWAKGIHCRHNKVAGYFSQVGRLYMVYHIWHYDSLQDRQEIRQNDWMRPGWDEILRDTIPLIKEMRSRWMIGNDFSPVR